MSTTLKIQAPGLAAAAARLAAAAAQLTRPGLPVHPPLAADQTSVATAARLSAAADELQADVRAGKLDGEAVAAVLAAAGHSVGRRQDWPAGLTTREIDVLRLVARGLSSKQIATKLVITPKTARNHIEHIYTKIDASSRVAASLFATEHGLL